MAWAQVHADLLASTKERIKGLEDLQALVSGGYTFEKDELHELVDVAGDLLADNNHKVSLNTLTILSSIIQTYPEAIKPYTGILVPMVVERLGDGQYQVRVEACHVLMDMMSHMPLGLVMEKMARGWTHRSWKVKGGIMNTIAEAVESSILDLKANASLKEHIITSAVNLLEDKTEHVREQAADLLKEIYISLGADLVENLKQQSIRPVVFRDLIAKLDTHSPTGVSTAELMSAAAGGSSHGSNDSGRSQAASAPAPGSSSSKAGVASKTRLAVATGVAAPADTAAAAPAAALVVSDRELLAELGNMATPLSGTAADWQLRISHMQRLQSLALGCPTQWHDVLLEGLRTLRDPITTQVEDRRSAVSKQACQVLSTLSSVLGLRFQELLTHFLPVLFKVLPITVQVMAEAADACCTSLLSSCSSVKAIPALAQAAIKDKNAKIRGFCTGYLAQVIESWEPSTLARCTEDLEAAMKSACQDSSSDARASARRMYSAYCSVLPEAAAQFTRTAPANLIDKLRPTTAKTTAAPSKRVTAKPFLSRPSSASFSGAAPSSTDPDIIIVAGPSRSSCTQIPISTGPPSAPAASTSAAAPAARDTVSVPRQSTAPGRIAVAGPGMVPGPLSSDSGVTTVAPVERRPPVPQGPTPVPAPPRRPAVPASRVPGTNTLDSAQDVTSALAALQIGPDNSRPPAPRARRASVGTYPLPQNPPTAPQRVPTTPMASYPGTRPLETRDAVPLPLPQPSSAPGSLVNVPGFGDTVPPPPLPTRASAGASSSGGSSGVSTGGARPQTLSKLTAALSSGSKPWNEKVELLTLLSDCLRGLRGRELSDPTTLTDSTTSLPTDPSRDLDKLVPKLLEMLEEAHMKVVVAALGALTEAVACFPHALEHSLDRVLPSVFVRQQDSKEPIRQAATHMLTEVCGRYSVEQLVPGLLRALDSSKQARVKQAVLEYGTSAMTPAPDKIRHSASSGTTMTASTTWLKQWLRAVSGLLNDKSLELRKGAADAVRAVYQHVDSECVETYARHSTGAEGLALKRLLVELEGGPAASLPSTTPAAQASTQATTGSACSASQMQTPSTTCPPPSGQNGPRLGGRPGQGTGSTWDVGGGGGVRGGGDVRSYPLELTAMEINGSRSSSGGGGVQAQHMAPYHPHGYMSPYKFDAQPAPAVRTITSDLGGSLLEEQGAYAVIASVTNPAAHTLDSTALWPGVANGQTLTRQGDAAVNVTAVAGKLSQPVVVVREPGGHIAAAPGAPTVALTQSVPEDVQGQMRLLHWHVNRLSGASALDALQQLQALCTAKIQPRAWQAWGHQLISEVLRHILVSPQPDVRDAGLALLAALGTHQPLLFSVPTQGLLETLLPGLTDCASAFDSQTSKTVFDTLDALLPALPTARALQVLANHLELSCTGGPGPGCQSVCVALQHTIASMSAEDLVSAVPAQLVQCLQVCASDGQLEVRKAAIYALAQLRLSLGEARFEPWAALLSVAQQQLVIWAHKKLYESEAMQK